MSKLKPCPFCGSPVKIARESFGYNIKCLNEECELVDSEDIYSDSLCWSSKQALAKEWNHRPIEDALTAQIEQLSAYALEMEAQLNSSVDTARQLFTYTRALEAQLAEAKKNALEWVTYDGTPETLPGIGETVLFMGADGVIVVYYRHHPEQGRTWEHFELGCDSFAVEPGDRWAYLPPSSQEKNNV